MNTSRLPASPGDKDGPLFRTTGTPHRLTQQDAYRLIQRHAEKAGIKTRIGNHTMRATGITDYLKSDGSLSEARKMANHADTRTTQRQGEGIRLRSMSTLRWGFENG
jgi:site-specific recombinase XerD